MTLIETLAAIALLAVVAPAVTKAWVVSMDVASRGRAEATAAMLGENLLAELALDPASVTVEEGDFGDEYPEFEYETDLAEWAEDSTMQELSVVVKWTRRDLEFDMTLTTLIPASDE